MNTTNRTHSATLSHPRSRLRTHVLILGTMLCGCLAAHALEVQNVTARQRWPWNSLVDIDFEIVTNGTENVALFNIDVSGTYASGVKTLEAARFVTEPLATAGVNRVTWNMGADFPALKASDLTLTVTVTEINAAEPVYLVVDLSEGPTANSYPTRYTTQLPDLADDTCRTDEIWLRRIPEGTFTMGRQSGSANEIEHLVTLSKPYYMGVFEVTQQQWYNVMGNWPSFFTNAIGRATRPIEYVTWSHIRGTNKGYQWPANSEVDSATFMDKIRSKTGLGTFDLPTEAQWERACRANTTTLLYSGETFNEANVAKLARYDNNGGKPLGVGTDDPTREVPPQFGSAKVGSYLPNSWGLYDMYGNVWERCLDIYQIDLGTEPVTDPTGPSGTTSRSGRGGALTFGYGSCTSTYRRELVATTAGSVFGFRLTYNQP